MTTTPLIAQLNRDWATLRHTAPDWDNPSAATLGAIRQAIPANPDHVLAELIAACQAGSQAAGLTVVQAFLGRIWTLCERDRRLDPDEAVAALWLRLATYPLARRPRWIAAALSRGVAVDLRRQMRPLVPLPAVQPPDPDPEAVLEQGRAWGLAPEEFLDAATITYVHGLTSADAAKRLHLKAGTVRWRCAAVARRLRPYGPLLADATAPLHPAQWCENDIHALAA